MQISSKRDWLFFMSLSLGLHALVLTSVTDKLAMQSVAPKKTQKNLSIELTKPILKHQNHRVLPKKSTAKMTASAVSKNQPSSASVHQFVLSSSQKHPTKKETTLNLAGTLTKDKAINQYEKQLLIYLQQKLSAPASLTGKVRLEIRIEYNQIATKVHVLSGGNPTLNAWAVKAIYAANPLPEKPANLAEPYVFRPTLKLQ